MGASIEREVKLRFDTPEQARAAVARTPASPLRARRLQEDALFDTPDEQLRRERCVVRVRNEGQRSFITYKGPSQPGPVKTREELETLVGDGELLQRILERIGLHVWFRYQKYREEFVHEGTILAVDETPIGTFVEVEGDEAGIARMAESLGKGPADYILDSYHRLFLTRREALGLSGRDMVFDDADRHL